MHPTRRTPRTNVGTRLLPTSQPHPLRAARLLFIESAKCLHGRPEPLKGSYYVNLFTHYRPKGNPEWFREKVRGATQQH